MGSKLPRNRALHRERLTRINLQLSDGSFKIIYIEQIPKIESNAEPIALVKNCSICPHIAGELKAITDGAGVSVDSLGQGNAGNLKIIAGSVILDRGAFLSATTASGENGNITLRSQDLLLLRRNSQISTAARGTGNGGNIDIDAGFIIALPSEDSNIIADAIEGRGGNINITAQGIFGIQPSEQQTSQSDITASSELGIEGEVESNTPDVDPNQMTVVQAEAELTLLENLFPILPDTSEIYAEWRRLVVTYSVMGVNVHDTRLVAAMRVHGLTHILTFNSRDFARYSEIMEKRK